jgi:hypothetical protein
LRKAASTVLVASIFSPPGFPLVAKLVDVKAVSCGRVALLLERSIAWLLAGLLRLRITAFPESKKSLCKQFNLGYRLCQFSGIDFRQESSSRKTAKRPPKTCAFAKSIAALGIPGKERLTERGSLVDYIHKRYSLKAVFLFP